VTTPLAHILRVQGHPASGPVELAVFGTADPDRIAGLITRAVQQQLGVAVAGGSFYSVSSGCVTGLDLADGRTVVLKAYQPHWEPAFLTAVQRVQRAAHQRGFPCPDPLAGPDPIGRGWATLEAFLPDPGLPAPPRGGPSSPELLDASATALVRLMACVDGVAADGLEQHPFRRGEGSLYPTPHSPIFDLDTTAEGAEWIDEWAQRALALRDVASSPPVISHLDWSARNVRLSPSHLLAVYDWDSLSLAPVAAAAGQSAATWRSTGETSDTEAPDVGEIDRFLSAFATARGASFTEAERSVAHGAALWVMAYSARCEHALEQRTPWRRTRARDWLRTRAGDLL
jgi:Ser/Thr protein kinase RdoA (MazF antagonist)